MTEIRQGISDRVPNIVLAPRLLSCPRSIAAPTSFGSRVRSQRPGERRPFGPVSYMSPSETERKSYKFLTDR